MNWYSRPAQLTLNHGVPGGLGHSEGGHDDTAAVLYGGDSEGNSQRKEGFWAAEAWLFPQFAVGSLPQELAMLHTEFACS